MNLTELSAIELKKLITSKQTTATEAMQTFLENAHTVDEKVKAFVSIDEEHILAQAKRVDEKIAQGKPLGKLAGIPVAIKDNMCVEGVLTTCSSRILEDFYPPYDAYVIEKIKAEDGILFGKTNLDEFAMGSSCENSAFFTTRNPHDLERVPGGSSGGSAAAVAARMVPVALGSDTGGSIRLPASFCGVLGIKPTYGRVSRYGLIAFASSLDQIGTFSRNAEDSALLLGVIAGEDTRDSTCLSDPVPEYLDSLGESFEGKKIGVPREYFSEGISPEVEKLIRDALEYYQSLGCEIVDIHLPHTEYAVATYYLVATAEASSNLARYEGVHYGYRAKEYSDMIDMYCQTREEGFGPEVKRRIMIGTYALSAGYYDAYYLKALKVRNLIRKDFENAFTKVDLIMGPTSPSTAFTIGAKVEDPLSMYLTDIYTISLNLTGLAGVSVPCGFTSDGLPVGLQIMGGFLNEGLILQASHAFEAGHDFHLRKPRI